jgi:hypothetical protein
MRSFAPRLSASALTVGATFAFAIALFAAPTADAASATVRIHGDWQPKLACDGCNPEEKWQGSGAGNTNTESVLLTDLIAGQRLEIGGLGGSVLNGTQRVDCIAGNRDTIRVPQHTPLLQFLNAQGNVVELSDGGYADTNAIRVVDALRTGITVPPGASVLWGSWPDEDYDDNSDLCYFTIRYEDGTQEAEEAPTVRTPRTTTSETLAPREAARRAAIQERTNGNSRANLLERITSGPAGVTGNGQAVLHELPVSDGRLLCKVQDRFLRPGTLSITRVRLAERLAERLTVSPITIVSVLESRTACPIQMNVQPIGGANVSESSSPITTPAPNAPSTSSSSSTRRPRTSSQSTERTPSATSTTTVEASSSEESVTDGSALSLEAKLRMLCRVQERGMQDPVAFRDQVETIAQRFADRWQMSTPAITAALLSSALCSEPERISLEGPSTPSQGSGSAIVGMPQSEEGDAPSAFNALLDRLPALPPIIIIVSALTVFTFLTLVTLLVIPLLKKD